MSDTEQLEVLKQILKSQIEDREQEDDPQQIGDILPFPEWIQSRYYAGSLASILWPYWKDQITEFEEGENEEWVITGSIGGGKSHGGEALMLYRTYVLSRYNAPQRLFGLSPVTTIHNVYLSVTKTKAERAGFSEMRNYIDSIPYFQKEYKRNPYRDSRLDFPNNVSLIYGTGTGAAQDLLSLAVYGVLFDEANFLKVSGGGKPGDLEAARRTYNKIIARLKSRFMKAGGRTLGFACIISSSDHDQSFTEKRIEEAQRTDQKRQKVTIVKPWKAKPGGSYCGKTFLVFVGDSMAEPRILEDSLDYLEAFASRPSHKKAVEDILGTGKKDVRAIFEELPSKMKLLIEEVPVEHEDEFRRDIRQSLRDVAGRSVSAEGKLFDSPALWIASVQAVPELKHPFGVDVATISLETKTTFLDILKKDMLFEEDENGKIAFRRHPQAPRYLHLDLSKKRLPTGMAMVHSSGYKTDTVSGYEWPIIELDFALRVTNSKIAGDEISHTEIVKFLLWLVNLGVPIGLISFDQKSSEMPLEILRSRTQIPTALRSLDKSDAPWMDAVTLFQDQRFHQYHYEPFHEEFFQLKHDRTKHKVYKDTNLKDVSDAVVGAIANALEKTSQHIDGMSRVKSLTGTSQIRKNIKESKEDASWVRSDYEKKMGKKVTSIDGDSIKKKDKIEKYER